MQHGEVFPESRFMRELIGHLLSEYGAKEEATYLADYQEPARRILIATDVGILELQTKQGPAGHLEMTSKLHLWPDVTNASLSAETYHEPEVRLRSVLTFSLPALGLNDRRNDIWPDRGLADFARVCAKRMARSDLTTHNDNDH